MPQRTVTGPDSTEFAYVTAPFRRELLAHCYRLLGSMDDAEDLVQETYLRAWRAYGGFEGRSSVRTWLYQITVFADPALVTRFSLPPSLPDRATGELSPQAGDA